MSEDQRNEEIDTQEEVQLEGGTYEVLRNRLLKQGDDLRERIGQLNLGRKDVFGSIETQLVATERITTDNNCVAWDMMPIGKVFLFGYNVHMGLRSEIKVEDVFSIYEFKDHQFHRHPSDLLSHPAFLEDFDNLYRYYKNTQFVKFGVRGTYLYMIFQVGKSVGDIKAFKWNIREEGLEYVDARSESEFKFPDQHQFSWKRTSRDMHREGTNPHISIEDTVFVETIGGDLTIKVEDNTDSGQGIYAEPVDLIDQTLDDAEIYYAIVGNIAILKIRPYQEKQFRYIVYNSKIQEARRIDAIDHSCVLLPDDHGLIFPEGYYLQNGEYKLFDIQHEDMLFEKRLASPNGEDYLYVFFNRAEGMYLLLSYNLIEQSVATPITCSGYSLFENGEMCFFKSDEEPKKHHVVQIWQTPYIGPDYEIETAKDSLLYKIGNKDIVKAMAQCNEILYLLQKGEGYANLYFDIMKTSTDVLDSYYWLGEKETFELHLPLQEIKSTASAAIDEFEKVTNIKKDTRQQVYLIKKQVEETVTEIKRNTPKHIDEFVHFLSTLRTLRGQIISLKELRYVILEEVEALEEQVANYTDDLSNDCVRFLVKPSSLKPYDEQVEKIGQSIDDLKKVVDANRVDENIDTTSQELEMLIDIVSNLKIEDATQTTQIIDHISGIYGRFNQIKASLKRKRKELLSVEGAAEFNAQINLVGQGLINYLDVADSPEKCEEYLTKLMVHLEELEGKFSEFDEFIDKIAVKREEVYSAFENRKIALTEARNRRANTLQQSADRILKAASGRVAKFNDVNEINGYFASDIMIDKARSIIEELVELGDTVKADDIQSRLKSVREDAIRQLKDKSELFVDGENTIKMGEHQFLVNTQPLELTIVNRHDTLCYHLTGTNFFEEISEEALTDTREFWGQSIVSENKEVYRAEYLAFQLFLHTLDHQNDKEEGWLSIEQLQLLDREKLDVYVVQFMSQRFNEGYEKGVHDQDATKILKTLLDLSHAAGLLKYSSQSRSAAAYWWTQVLEPGKQQHLNSRLKGAGTMLQVFPKTKEFVGLKKDIVKEMASFLSTCDLFLDVSAEEAGNYLFDEITQHNDFVVDSEAAFLYKSFYDHLKKAKSEKSFQDTLDALDKDGEAKYRLILSWLHGLNDALEQDYEAYLQETALLILNKSFLDNRVAKVTLKQTITGMIGTHSNIEKEHLSFDLNEFMHRLRHFSENTVPQYEGYIQLKKDLIKNFTEELRLGEFKPRVMNAFVRNQLIDKVYLPIIGANLAKQIGAAGAGKRTDLMGMLLLISPPGYGKTTLMEYIANRLGLIFMKINGPAIGHEITSTDPSQAKNAGAREELEKLNLAFEMGDNVMIYLDDIQHTNPEFLQKFISLCDAQRKIEGVYKGKSKTYDFRGKKVCVIMAGNPYTESGEKFQIPDMLSNRADIYNLGDILGDSADVFKLSYIENCLTSNRTLHELAQKSHKDVLSVVQIAQSGQQEGIDFEANHSAVELSDYVKVMKKILTVRDTIWTVNEEYIRSAGQADAYREAPPFKLQGSYRDMNKIAEKVVPIMNDQELQVLVNSHYENEAQTLTTGAEANLLRYKELTRQMSDEDVSRWSEIKATFQKLNRLKSMGGENGMGQLMAQIETLSGGLSGIEKALLRSSDQPALPPSVPEKNVPSPTPNQVNETLEKILHIVSSNQKDILQELKDQKAFDEGVRSEKVQREKAKQEARIQKDALIAKALKDEEEKLNGLREQIQVVVTEKGFIDEAAQSYITFKFAFENLTKNNVTGVLGTIEFLGLQDEEVIHRIDVSYDEFIAPGATSMWEAQIHFNPFLDKDILLRDLGLENLRTQWIPRKILLD